MDDAPTEDGVYPVPIAAAELAVLREMCEADFMPVRLEQCSISELFRLVEGASFLDAPGALNHAQCALATRLNGKRADGLRELLGATDDFGSAENRVAALAEPAFSPEGQLSVATAGSAAGPPALPPQPSLSGMAVTDDAKEVALGMVDVGTLAELKGVNRSWLALARRVLCSRLSWLRSPISTLGPRRRGSAMGGGGGGEDAAQPGSTALGGLHGECGRGQRGGS